MRPRKLPNQNCAVSNQLVDDGRGGGGVGADTVTGGEYSTYELSDINGYKRTLKNADWKPFLNSHRSRVTTSFKHYIFAFEPDNDFEKL
jgi:hypothetical protein